MAQAYMRGISVEQDARASAPLITLFERDDSIAVPLLSQLRMAGYDVRSARTPVELFDILGKNLVTLVLVDLGAATAGRREFWVALDAQRRGRAMQVLTFRYSAPASDLDLDFEPSARAIADVEIHGAHEFQRVIDAVRQRAPLFGPAPSAAVSYTPDGAIAPLGAALGLAPAPYAAQHDAGYPGFDGQGGYGAPAAVSQQQGYPVGYAPAFGPGYAGGAFGMSPLSAPTPLGGSPSGVGGFNSIPPGGFPPAAGYPQGFGAALAPQFNAQMETAPISESMYSQGGFQPGVFAPQSQPNSQPFSGQPFSGQPFSGQPGAYASPFAQPTAANPFSSNPFSPDVVTSPFAQPYGSNPFGPDAHTPSAPSMPASPFAQGVGQSVNPFAAGFPGGQSGPSTPSGPVSGPASWGGGSGGYVAAAQGFSGWRTPDDIGPASFGSDPGAQSMFGAPHSPAESYFTPPTPPPSAPVFQDAWTPPDDADETETSALSEDAFQTPQSPSMPHSPMTPADAWSAATSEPRRLSMAPQYSSGQERPWDAPRGPSGDLPQLDQRPASGEFDSAAGQIDQDILDLYERSTAAVATPVSAVQTHGLEQPPTPTEAALGSVLVEGALLTPGKLEKLRGIQQMLSSAGQPRKLGELAVMFKFLSSDQLLAALLVSRGLVSPQQIASLGRVKQEMAAAGQENDLETLLVRYNILPADELRHLRQEIAS